MTTRAKRFLMATLVGVAGLTFLLHVADLSQIDLGVISLELAILPVLYLSMMVALRGDLLRRVAPPRVDVPRPRWLRLAAHHQLLFMVAPSGLGDAGFFALAKYHAGLDSAEAAAAIVLYRLRDAIVLLSLGIVGGLMMAGMTPLALIVAAWAMLALCFTEEAVALALGILKRLIPDGRVTRFLSRAESVPQRATRGRIARTLIVIGIWVCSALATATAFAAAGHPLSVLQTILMMAALNASGAIAISFGGIGVAEAGAAGMLMLFGETGAKAAAVALLARPLLFLSAVAASVTIDFVSWLTLRNQPSAKH